jgi:uracil phosphoribosyltransferase
MLKIIDHPLVKVKMTELRNKNSNHSVFKQNVREIASLMVYEALKNVELKEIEIETPITKTIGFQYKQDIIVVGILRAGLGLMQGVSDLIPQARMGHIGIYRDEKTFEAKQYFYKIPEVAKDSKIILVDPMLATGASANKSIDLLKKDGFTNIQLVCLLGVQEGVDLITKHHPNVNIMLAALDEKLNEDKYIVPGLGDAGDRIFGTK